MNVKIVLGLAFAIVIVIGLLAPEPEPEPAPPTGAEPEPEPAPYVKPLSIELTAAEAASIAGVIRGVGLNCPAVKLAWAKGQDARGIVFKAFCGPADREGVYPNVVFRVTLRPDGRYLVEPWE